MSLHKTTCDTQTPLLHDLLCSHTLSWRDISVTWFLGAFHVSSTEVIAALAWAQGVADSRRLSRWPFLSVYHRADTGGICGCHAVQLLTEVVFMQDDYSK